MDQIFPPSSTAQCLTLKSNPTEGYSIISLREICQLSPWGLDEVKSLEQISTCACSIMKVICMVTRVRDRNQYQPTEPDSAIWQVLVFDIQHVACCEPLFKE